MSKRSESVKRWRKNSKKRMVDAMGGKCQCCTYNKCHDALEFHHLDPTQKDISLGGMRANPKRWSTIILELKKCILLCSNCHREVHEGITPLPETYDTFDPSFEDYKRQKEDIFHPCPVCGVDVIEMHKFCSLSCSGKSKQRVDWDSVDLKMLLTTTSVSGIAESLNISFAAVNKRMKKIGIEDRMAG